MRREIEAGRGAAWLDRILALAPADRDPWLDEVLGIEHLPADAPLPQGSTPYLPAGVDAIVAMVQALPLRAEDHFVDLGSGLGRVVMLAHLLSGARCTGIEIQEHLVRKARASSEALALEGVSFHEANVEDVTLEGSVFFLYSPFSGAMLRNVLARLAAVKRPFVVATVDLELDVDWLRARPTANVSLAIYDAI